ncbi:MAG: thiamine pyrophosphate-dependent dehydrogenase E1 component subunit alpha [Candidatus Hinthialibacter antarcticus]|nr:thiamine pyrophosphate-dependent dehydrogenase E1 component subunit alpha [Candidatus Hinthialibacter antarcticus]
MDQDIRKKLYTDIRRIRLIEERIADQYAEQEMRCPVHLSIGQEAAAVGVCSALQKRDRVLSGHRSHAHYLAKGGDLKRMLAEIYGKETGCSKGMGGSMHLTDLDAGFVGATPIVGSTIPIAVGVALSIQMREEDQVVAIFFGDGAAEAGVFHESLNFAVLKRLPILFVCENNLYSVYSPLNVRQPEGRSLSQLAEGLGAATRQGDGNTVEEVFGVTQEAAQQARTGEGPVFLEFSTYRWREHCGPNYDNDIGYRTEEEYQAWRKKDPVAACAQRLLADGAVQQSELNEFDEIIGAEIDDAFAFAKDSAFPPADDLFAKVYA